MHIMHSGVNYWYKPTAFIPSDPKMTVHMSKLAVDWVAIGNAMIRFWWTNINIGVNVNTNANTNANNNVTTNNNASANTNTNVDTNNH